MPPLFRSFLEVAGDRVVPTTLSKATLTDLSHALEELVLSDDAPGTVLTGFQESQHWHAERARYEALASPEHRTVAVFAQGRLGSATDVHRFTLTRAHPLAQEWFLFALTARFSAALFARELPDQEVTDEPQRRFATVWTFTPAVIADLLAALHGAARTVSDEAARTVQEAIERLPPVAPDPHVQQRFANAVIERLEASRLRWAETSNRLRTDGAPAVAMSPAEQAGPMVEHGPADGVAAAAPDEVSTTVLAATDEPVHADPTATEEGARTDPVAEPPPAEQEVADSAIATAAEPARRGHVLVAEEEAPFRGLMEALLRRDGWEVSCVGTAAEARRVIDRGGVDVALLGLELGRHSGRDLLRRINAARSGQRTACAYIADGPSAGTELDGCPVLVKPFAWQALVTVLDRLGVR